MTLFAGDRPPAQALNDYGGLIAVKLSNETVNNTATFQNDNELFVTVEANCDYICHLHLIYNSGTAPDFKYQFTYPAGALLLAWSAIYFSTTLTLIYGINGDAQSPGGSGANLPVDAWGTLRTGANAGTLQLQWAQNAATASDTIVGNGSFLHLRKVLT